MSSFLRMSSTLPTGVLKIHLAMRYLLIEQREAERRSADDRGLLSHQLKDYANVGLKLMRQRQMTFVGALVLAGFYYDIRVAIVCLISIAVSEVYDFFTFRSIAAWTGQDNRIAQQHFTRLLLGSILSSGVVVFFAVGIALVQGPGPHFISMFFLLAAGLFAAMHNHQVLQLLILRLVIYAAAFVFIPLWDIIVMGANIRSDLWAQFFTSLFVLYFVIDCSKNYLSIYRVTQDQMLALEVETRKAQEGYKAKSEFLATMSHELRTPLTSIKGSIDLMNAGLFGPMTDKVANVMAIAQRNCNRLVKLVDDTLDLQKIIAGKMAFTMDRIAVSEMVQEVVSSNLPYAERLGVALELALPPAEAFVLGDRARLEQVLTNILSNAAKFTKQSTTVRIIVDSNEERVRVLVVDQGVGLTEKDRADVFDRYRHVDSCDTRKIGGTGLGMNISEKIMQAHDGKIDYYKNDGAGTTFFMEMKSHKDPEPDSARKIG
jgi:signal transduction histidine kinase